MAKIAIDPGHGGRDPGVISAIAEIPEKDINLAVAKKLSRYLKGAGHEVQMTRDHDITLERSERIVSIPADSDMLISIHHNAFEDTAASGAEVFYPSRDTQSAELAEQIMDDLSFICGLRQRGAKENSNFYILHSTGSRAKRRVLAENGFLTNGIEAVLLSQDGFQEREAIAIAGAIIKTLTK